MGAILIKTITGGQSSQQQEVIPVFSRGRVTWHRKRASDTYGQGLWASQS